MDQLTAEGDTLYDDVRSHIIQRHTAVSTGVILEVLPAISRLTVASVAEHPVSCAHYRAREAMAAIVLEDRGVKTIPAVQRSTRGWIDILRKVCAQIVEGQHDLSPGAHDIATCERTYAHMIVALLHAPDTLNVWCRREQDYQVVAQSAAAWTAALIGIPKDEADAFSNMLARILCLFAPDTFHPAGDYTDIAIYWHNTARAYKAFACFQQSGLHNDSVIVIGDGKAWADCSDGLRHPVFDGTTVMPLPPEGDKIVRRIDLARARRPKSVVAIGDALAAGYTLNDILAPHDD